MERFWWLLLGGVLFVVGEGLLAQWRVTGIDAPEGYKGFYTDNTIWGGTLVGVVFLLLGSWGIWCVLALAAWVRQDSQIKRAAGCVAAILWASLFLCGFLAQQSGLAYEELGLDQAGTLLHTKVYFPPGQAEKAQTALGAVSWIGYYPATNTIAFKREDGSLIHIYPLKYRVINREVAETLAKKLEKPLEPVE